ncbi:MAG: SPOR domain-containing protein, partial [Magnetococcales bacterium]|nr:SPOR domain-containing protein [Magnetococcales bacterium]
KSGDKSKNGDKTKYGDKSNNGDKTKNGGKSKIGEKPFSVDDDNGVILAPGPDTTPVTPQAGEGDLPETGGVNPDGTAPRRTLDQDLKKWFLPNREKNKPNRPQHLSPPPPLPEEAPKPGAATEGNYSVFLGSFSVPKLAERVVQRAEQSGTPVYQRTSRNGNRTAILVYAGPFQQENAAQAVLTQMQKDQDLIDGYVVQTNIEDPAGAGHNPPPSGRKTSPGNGRI